jgi:chromosome segregation ATPase
MENHNNDQNVENQQQPSVEAQEQPQPSAEPQPQQEQPSAGQQEEFINKANVSQKVIGHHKLQMHIDELQAEIEKHKLHHKEQDTKLTLFKKTIANLQTQLQEKIAQANSRNNNDSNQQGHINDLMNRLNSNEREKQEMYNKISELNEQLSSLRIELENTNNEKNTLSQKFMDMKKRCQILEASCEEHVHNLNQKEELISQLKNQTNLAESLTQKTREEIVNMSNELNNSRQQNESSKIEFQCLLNELTELKKLHGIMPPVQEIDDAVSSVPSAPTPVVGSSRRSLPVAAGRRTIAKSNRK